MVGLTAKAISRWENSTSYPDITLLPILANIFEITVDELLDVDIYKKEHEMGNLRKKRRKNPAFFSYESPVPPAGASPASGGYSPETGSAYARRLSLTIWFQTESYRRAAPATPPAAARVPCTKSGTFPGGFPPWERQSAKGTGAAR